MLLLPVPIHVAVIDFNWPWGRWNISANVSVQLGLKALQIDRLARQDTTSWKVFRGHSNMYWDFVAARPSIFSLECRMWFSERGLYLRQTKICELFPSWVIATNFKASSELPRASISHIAVETTGDWFATRITSRPFFGRNDSVEIQLRSWLQSKPYKPESSCGVYHPSTAPCCSSQQSIIGPPGAAGCNGKNVGWSIAPWFTISIWNVGHDKIWTSNEE